MAQIRSITSEALEAQIRDLLPSQNGFTEDLQASNVITPIIDLTAAASGGAVRQDLQTALAFGSQSSFTVTNTTSTVVNNTGFWRVFGNFSGNHSDATARIAQIRSTNGLANKIFLDFGFASTQNDNTSNNNVFDFVYFAAAGESLVAQTDSSILTLYITVRQIADINGTLVNPSGFTPQ